MRKCLKLEADITATPEVRHGVALLRETSPAPWVLSPASPSACSSLPAAPLRCQPVQEERLWVTGPTSPTAETRKATEGNTLSQGSSLSQQRCGINALKTPSATKLLEMLNFTY